MMCCAKSESYFRPPTVQLAQNLPNKFIHEHEVLSLSHVRMNFLLLVEQYLVVNCRNLLPLALQVEGVLVRPFFLQVIFVSGLLPVLVNDLFFSFLSLNGCLP